MAVGYQRVRHPTDTHVNKLDEQVKNVVDQVNANAIKGVSGSQATAASLGPGAAATNVGMLGGDLGGTLPNPNIARGTAFPAGPSTNQFFFRTDQGLLYFYNGTGWSPFTGCLTAITASSAGINTTETDVVSFSVPAGLAKAGTCFRIKIGGTCVSTVANSSNFIVRIRTAGTSADTAFGNFSVTAGTSGAAAAFTVEALITVRAAGASVAVPVYQTLVAAGGGVDGAASTVLATLGVFGALTSGMNTTVANFLHLAYKSAAVTTTCTFDVATIELVRP